MSHSALHQYRVQRVEEAPRSSHGGFMFPHCLYTLLRQDDQTIIRVTLPKSRRLSLGDLVELDDWTVRMARCQP